MPLPPLQNYFNHKRASRYWEPVYKPETASAQFTQFDWDLKNSHGPKSALCEASELAALVGSHDSHTIRNAIFETCDFDGVFDFCRLSFQNCKFRDCDFGRSKWFDVKFSRCIFEGCSISTVSFYDTQFIDCSWEKLGLSAEEMDLKRVLISNPHAFIHAAYTNIDKDVLAQKNTNARYQLYRLEKTKSKIARKVLLAVQASADDDAYYNAIMTHTDQLSAWKAAEAKFFADTRHFGKKLFWYPVWLLYLFERILLRTSGSINGWGGKVGRAFICGLGLIIAYSMIYDFYGIYDDYKLSILAAIEITLLVGFTKYTTTSMPICNQFLVFTNVLLGLWWYAIFLPTIINRISRVRQ